MLRIAIVGLGSWGVCALERIVTNARAGLDGAGAVEVHVIEPGTPGSGIYNVGQPDYLRLNNACGELSLYPFESAGDQPAYAVGLYDWARRAGYHWIGHTCQRDPSGRPLTPHDYLPRRLMGEYLQWFYRTLVAEAPRNLSIIHHPTSAVGLIPGEHGGEELLLRRGERVCVDHVIVTSGHTANRMVPGPAGMRQRSPFPVGDYVDSLPDQVSVGVSGFGLVAVDVVTALTTGRGGHFSEQGGRLVYLPSGREPQIQLFSRSGLPFTGKSVTGLDRTDVYQPVICTPQALDALSSDAAGARRSVDLRGELLPLLFAEMHVRYFAQRAFGQGGLDAAREVTQSLALASQQGILPRQIDALRDRFGHYDAEEHFFGPRARYANGDDYEAAVYRMLADDFSEAQVPGGRSAMKSAAEVFRIFRDPMRGVVEHGGLSLESHLDFNRDVASRIKRLIAGPPALRSEEFMAMMDAGVLRIQLGPAPGFGTTSSAPDADPESAELRSTLLEQPRAASVDVLIKGHLEEPRIDGTASELLASMYAAGRISQFRYGSVSVGSIDLTRDGHPIDIDGRPQMNIWMFGVLTEGIRHFTHYVPSPKSRIRAVVDIGDGVEAILG